MADEQAIGADEVARKQFGTAFRGFDQYEVRAFLALVAAELASARERERALRDRLELSESRPPTAGPVGEDELEAALGVETTRVLHAARQAAAEIRSKAEDSVARLLREANDEAGRTRAEAEGLLAQRTEEAEAAAGAILGAAEEAAATMRADAEAAAEATIEEATTRGREMVAEAQAVRERLLKDLSRRRRAAGQQLEQLLAGRERLIAAYDVVRENVDLVTRELSVAEDEARLAAEVAGLRPVADEPDPIPAADEAPVPADPEPAPRTEPEPEPAPAAVAEPAIVAVHDVVTIEEAPPAPLPVGGSAGDDRRSSSLRLLRRKAETEAVPPPEDEIESVRIIRPATAPPPRPVAVPDLPAASTAAPEPESEPVAEGAQEPAPAAEEAPDGLHGDDTPVDDLFARLRADRAAAVAQAEVVLAESSVAVLESESVPEPAPEATPDPVVVEEDEVAVAADALFERRDATIEAAERALTRALKRVLADEQNEVLDALRRLRGTPKLELLLPEAGDHAARYAAAALEHLTSGATAGAASFDGAVPAVDELAAALGAEVTEDLRARVERTLDASRADDEALVQGISATYREWKTSRSEPLARHHLVAAHAAGAFAAMPAGLLRWVVDPAEGGCPDCDDNALAGATDKGDAFPTGQPHPPAHSGCRCLVLPDS